ncbi:cytochrome c [Candidatus Binatia bacterium]|nr:cytochrome c [Candidatus Binatia bacterium]
MNRLEAALLAGALLSVGAAVLVPAPVAPTGSTGERPRATPGVRLTMMELHRQGGVPRGWKPRVPPGDAAAGRETFVALGCPACHRVAGEPFSATAPSGPGPELTGMGSHHPAAYFAEALLDPDAVILEGAGWIDDDGHSTMPAYPDMTVRQLGDLVAYLTSLRQPEGTAAGHGPGMMGGAMPVEAVSSASLPDAPAAPPGRTYYAQSYDVLPGRRAAFENWFAATGKARFLEIEGLEAVDTYVDLERPDTPLTTVLAFRDEAAFRTFLADPASAELWQQLDGFIGPHGHRATDRPPLYRASGLSLDLATVESRR